MRGVVTAVSATSLVIRRLKRQGDDLAFVLLATTERSGTIAVGTEVSVRYRIEGHALVATALIANRGPATPRGAAVDIDELIRRTMVGRRRQPT